MKKFADCEVKVMKRFAGSSIFWGVVLICTAVLLIFNSLGISVGYLDGGGLPVVRIVLGVLCAAWLITEIVKLRFARIFVPLAFILLLFEGELASMLHVPGKDIYSSWTILLCAALLTAGVSLLTHGRNRHFKIGKDDGTLNVEFSDKTEERDNETAEHDDGGDITCHLSSVTKYIDCTNFTKKQINCDKGSVEIFFENTDRYTGGGELVIANNMGSVEIHIPEDWYTVGDIINSLGSVELPRMTEKSVKPLRISGANNVGSVEISR